MSYVYFIGCGPMEAVKIGVTRSSPQSRLANLQTGCPAPLKLLAYFPGTADDERRLHEAFRPLHIQGEWFRLEWKLRDFVWYLQDNPEPIAASREQFENALHDVLMQGNWYPDSPISQDAYRLTGNWHPFHNILWEAFGPWDIEATAGT